MNVQNMTHIARAGERRNLLSEFVVRTCHNVAAFVLAAGLGVASVTVGLGQNNPQNEPSEKEEAPATRGYRAGGSMKQDRNNV